MMKEFRIIPITEHTCICPYDNAIENDFISKSRLIRKSGGFVYEIWQYRVLIMKKENIRSEIILEENNR